MGLKEQNFKVRYSKANDDIAAEFYMPCMENAIIYDRISGYFRSTLFIISWKVLKKFIHNGGKMRIICSPYIAISDQEAATKGYEARNIDDSFEQLNKELIELFEDEYLKEPAKVLACLIGLSYIDIKIAVGLYREDTSLTKLFHEKAGIFIDTAGNAVAFEGSMNETYNGLAQDGNIEAVNVFINWEDAREKERVTTLQDDFESLWQNRNKTVKLYEFPEETKAIISKHATNCNWENIVDDLIEKDIKVEKWKADRKKGGRTPRPHQVAALETWTNSGRRGILEHATGSGKTYTALCAIRDALDRNEVPLILVPSKELLRQWAKEVDDTFAKSYQIRVLLCGDNHNAWRSNGLLAAYTTPSKGKSKAVIAIMDTASTDDFIGAITQSDKLFIVADEVHRLGSEKRRNVFNIQSGPRLGLSATPKRYGDSEGTQSIIDYFERIIEPPFTLEDAIKADVLTKYYYYPHRVMLTPNEQLEWDKVTKKLSIEVARKNNVSDNSKKMFEDPYIKSLLLYRARLLKNASTKVALALEVINKYYDPQQKWIVYCDNQKQLRAVLTILNDNGFRAYEYHSNMRGDRSETLKFFKTCGGILVSIKCLDEGVDIPAATHALILASSKNPREFIQRRGRILRKADDQNKLFAYLHDAIVIPNCSEEPSLKQASIVESELARAVHFGKGSLRAACITELEHIAIEYGVDLNNLEGGGIEDDD